MKNSTFSAQVANNLLKVLQGYTKGIRLIALLTMLCTIGVGQMWAEEELYQTALFGSSYNSKKVSSYTDTWTATNNGFTVTVVNANNNNNGWAYIKMGRKSYTSVGSITTQAAIDKPISKVTMTIDAVTAKNINSIKLKTSIDGSSFVEVGNFTISTGEQSVTINNPTADLYYQIEVDCKTGSNGSIQISKVQYYATEDAGSGGDEPVTPTPVDPTATFSNGEYTVGGAALDLSTLWESNSDGTVTYSVKTNGGTGASISGTSFTATTAGSCTVQASQAAATGYNAITKTATITVNPAQGGGSGSGDNYTITFATGTNTTATTSSVQLSTMISDGDENVKSFVVDGTDKYVYHKGAGASNATGSGLRLGKSGGKGKITFNLSDEIAAQNLSSISVTTAAWDASTTVSLVVNGSATTTANAGNTIAYTPSTTTKLSSITLSATARAFIKTITITTSSSAEPTQLPAPTGLTATNITSTSATLSWNAVANASSYVVQILDDGNTNIEQSTTDTTITVTGLNPSTLHYWGVTAVGDGTNYTNSNESNTSEFTTEAASTPTYYTITLNPNYPAGKKGTFIDTVGNAVDGDLKISWLGETKTTPIANLYSSISLDGYIFEGWYEITAEGEKNRKNTGTITSDTTFYARWKVPYTVTFDAGTGSCDKESITETTANGITLPTATLEDCGNWVFLGWAENAIESETKDAPASFFAGGSTYKPTGNITLYAIYKRVEGGGSGEEATATLSFADKAQRTEYTKDIQVWAQNGITLTNNKASSTTDVGDYADPARFYANSQIIISAPRAITQIVADCDESKYATALVSSIGTDASASGITATITPTTQSETYEITLTGQTRFNSISVTYGGGLDTSYYHSEPYCQTCEKFITINKGAETNGTFTLDISGDIETCETEVSVVVKPTPANHYHIGSVTATTPTTGGAPTVTDNGNGTYTVTYVANSTGESTINVTFEEDAKATINLYELGVLTTITSEYIGDLYTLPSTSSQSCGTKTLVGWSTVTFPETDTKPTENYVGIGSRITLAETQTYYAVFAQSSGGGGGSGDYERVTAALDDWSGDYLIAYDNQTFADGSTGGKTGIGAEGKKVDLSENISNNTIPSNTGDQYNVTLVAIDGGYVLQTKDSQYNYQTNNSNGLANTENIEIAKKYPLTVTFNNENDIAIANSAGAVFHYNKSGSGYFRFYENGGQQQVYLYKKSGTAATYTGYTTSCAVITGIEVDNPRTTFDQYDAFEFGGKVYAIDENSNRVDVTSSATFTGYDMKKAGTDTVTVTYLSFQTTYEITINDVDEWLLTWNVNGATNTGLAPTHVIKGNAIGTLPKPKGETPAGCEKKTFVGWTESNEVNADGSNITYITSETVPSKNTTYYAVFATPSGISGVGGYVKLTETPADLSGEYLIVYEDGAVAFNGGLTTLDAASNTISVTITDNTIEATNATNAAKFTIAKHGTAYLITSASEYHIGQTSDANGLLSNKSTTYTNNISITDGNADIIASGGAYLRYNKTSGDTRFRYYKSSTYTGQQPIALYKKSGSSASYTDYTTGCHDVTITYYGFNGGYTTNCGGSDLNVIKQRVNSAHTIPTCTEITDPTDLGRTFLNLWKDQNGKEHKPGDSFIVTQDITLYAQWKLETTGDITLPAGKEDLATTDIVVTGGKTLTIPEGKTITINSLTLKGGLLGENSESGYAMPSVVIPDNATLVRKNTTINLDLVVNNDSWYPFAVPFALDKNDNIDYLDPVLKAASTYNKHFAIKTYDGANRAIVGTDQKNNWDKVPQAAGLQPGKGYIISALTYPDKDTATIRIPMSVDNAWLANGEQTTVNEVTRNQVAVTAYTGKASDPNEGGHQRHAGWNFVANPYLSNFTGGGIDATNGLDYIDGKLIIQGSYEYSKETVPYVTIPAYNFAYYSQYKLSEAPLSPAYSFFVQVGTEGTMTFETAGRQAAPASIAARNAEERPVKMDVDITLSDNHSSDQTGIIISDRYSEAYEIGRDLEKLFGSAYNLSVYTLMADNTPLAFQALAIRSNMQVIPVGYRTPAQGEYTFRLNEATSSIDLLNEQYEQLVLVDYQTGELTNLLISDYTFYSERVQSDSRFALYAVPRQNAPTDLPNAIGQDKQAQKIIHNGHLYILRDGNVYNGNGQIVK